MLYFSSQLKTDAAYSADAENIFSAFFDAGEQFDFILNTKDIWVRDYMPVKTKSGKFVSFRYEPGYLKNSNEVRTDYREDISSQFNFPVTYSTINLDGGNVVFSPSKTRAIISDRIFSENPIRDKDDLIKELSGLLEAEIIIIESLKSDFTGHADGMARFLDEHTVLLNKTDFKNGLEQRQARALKGLGFNVIEFPYYQCGTKSAEGSYLNYLETSSHIFLPIFGHETDSVALSTAKRIFCKEIVPIKIHSVANDGGALNCISWEK